MTTYKKNCDYSFVLLSLFNKNFILKTNRIEPLMLCLDATFSRNYRRICTIDNADEIYNLTINHGASNTQYSSDDKKFEKAIQLEPGICMSICEDSKSFSICLPDDSGRNTLRLILSAVSAFIQISLLNDDIYFIHASAVSFRNIGIIFSGPNESGKSSLLRSLLSHNASYLSDDACLIRSNSKKTIIIPNPESITCLEMSSDETESLLKRGFDFANDDRFLMPPINFQESVELNFIFFPEIVEVKQKIVSLTKKEAALKLLKSVKTPLSKKAQVKWFKFVCDICETTNFAKLFIERNSTFNTEEIINYCELLSS